MWPPYGCPCRLVGGQPLTYVGDPFFFLGLLGQRPAPQGLSQRQPLGKSLRATKRHDCLCLLCGGVRLATKLVQPGCPVARKCQGERMGQRLGPRQAGTALLQGLLRIA
jgi:hypothetical protein